MEEITAKEFSKLFIQHLNIAKYVFGKYLCTEEANEMCEHAVKVAILTHDPEKGSLSTHVHNIAYQYKQEYIRQNEKWSGAVVRRKVKPFQDYIPPHRHVQKVSNNDDNDDGGGTGNFSYDVLENNVDIGFLLDVRQHIEELERKRPRFFGGKLLTIIESILAGETEKEISVKLKITRQLVSQIRIKARKKLKKKLEELLRKN